LHRSRSSRGATHRSFRTAPDYRFEIRFSSPQPWVLCASHGCRAGSAGHAGRRPSDCSLLQSIAGFWAGPCLFATIDAIQLSGYRVRVCALPAYGRGTAASAGVAITRPAWKPVIGLAYYAGSDRQRFRALATATGAAGARFRGRDLSDHGCHLLEATVSSLLSQSGGRVQPSFRKRTGGCR